LDRKPFCFIPKPLKDCSNHKIRTSTGFRGFPRSPLPSFDLSSKLTVVLKIVFDLISFSIINFILDARQWHTFFLRYLSFKALPAADSVICFIIKPIFDISNSLKLRGNLMLTWGITSSLSWLYWLVIFLVRTIVYLFLLYDLFPQTTSIIIV